LDGEGQDSESKHENDLDVWEESKQEPESESKHEFGWDNESNESNESNETNETNEESKHGDDLGHQGF